MPAFDLVVIGCGGGPNETNLSSYFLKTHDASWNEGIISIEAGSGLGALERVLQNNPGLLESPRSAAEVLSWIRSYLITHAHLDHVSGLVLAAGSLNGPTRRILSTRDVLKDIQGIFSDRLWPNLASWNSRDPSAPLLYSQLTISERYAPVAKDVSVRVMPISHGQTSTQQTYDSSAFFVRHDPSSKQLLFFGDVEPDSLSTKPRTIDVWRVAAPMIPRALDTIFIECSYPAGRPNEQLYGHLSPEHLAAELSALAQEVAKLRNNGTAQVLRGVRVYITHCKDDLAGQYHEPIHLVIATQVRNLVDQQNLGVEIIAAEQGMQITI
ncbi:3',5'-cyclic-nucleotide phosphodiesterase [Phanerochaete sordida]|uniref:3',5'-cyclic-nucleotide phosphodiesterase n=1 Tax=Phanerochaete sordida TaxID=48140 RepID=A0A9P3G2A5_9APHY|nr:3',5'-cyclic-nucleotide phosphodiesterase [Phanerochaete sordida]